jgi:DNA topoisomerase VI subunit B
MWVIDRGVGIYDFLMYSLEYIKHELTQEKSLNKRIYILKRIQFLAEVIEKLSNTYLEEQNENLSKIIEELIISNLEEQNENLSKAIDDLNKIFYIK